MTVDDSSAAPRLQHPGSCRSSQDSSWSLHRTGGAPARTHLCDADGVLRSTANAVELPEPPDPDRPVMLSLAAHRLVEGVAASLAGGSAQPLWREEDLMRRMKLILNLQDK